MFDDIGFYLVTYNRGIRNQKTFEQLPIIIKRKVNFVIYEDENEIEGFKKIGKVFLAKCPKGIHHKRQYVIDNSPEKYIFFMDDDVLFYKKKKDNKLIRASKSQLLKMFLMLSNWLKDKNIGQVGISFRAFNNFESESYKEIQQVYSIFGFNKELFKKLSLRCDNAPFMEDTQITLGLISKGFKNRITYEFAVNQVAGSKGGCSTYRTSEKQETSAISMNKLFPRYTKIINRKPKEKKDKLHSYDIKIFWSRAYKEGLTKRNQNTMIGKFL